MDELDECQHLLEAGEPFGGPPAGQRAPQTGPSDSSPARDAIRARRREISRCCRDEPVSVPPAGHLPGRRSASDENL